MRNQFNLSDEPVGENGVKYIPTALKSSCYVQSPLHNYKHSPQKKSVYLMNKKIHTFCNLSANL